MRPTLPFPARRSRRGEVNKTGLIIGGVIALIVIIALIVLRPRPVPAPTGFTHYAAVDHTFTCDAPNDWRRIEATSHNTDSGAVDSADTPGGVLFAQGSATIDVTIGRIAEMLKTDLLSSSGPIPDSLTGSKAAVLHRQDKAKLKMAMKNVTSEPSKSYQGGFGDTVAQEWRVTGNAIGLGGAQHGYLVSMVGAGHTATITCQCAESDWPTLKPAFLHVINSIAETGVPAEAPAYPASLPPSDTTPSDSSASPSGQ